MIKVLFGKLFWIWIVGFILGSVYLLAETVNNLRILWQPKVIVAPKQRRKHLVQEERKKSINVILASRNIFDPKGALVVGTPPTKTKKEEKKPKKEEKSEEPKVIQSGGCPPMPLNTKLKELKSRMRLMGISYVEEDPSFSLAAIYVKVKRKKKKRKGRYYRRFRRVVWQTKMFRVGDMVMGNKLCLIKKQEVILYKYGKFAKLSLYSKKKRKEFVYGAIGLSQLLQTQGPGEVKVSASDKFTISRKTVNNWLANPMQYAMSARIMPHYINGQPAGFRLVWVRKGSLYSQIGLKSGDIVQQINGKNISVGTALSLYSQLPYAKQLRVNIIRKGVRRSLLYTIK